MPARVPNPFAIPPIPIQRSNRPPLNVWISEHKKEIDYYFNYMLNKMKLNNMEIIDVRRLYVKWARMCYHNSFINIK